MLTKDTAIVLHSFKLGESKMVVDLLTSSGGRLSCVAPMPKSSKSKIKKQFFQPMTILEIEYEQRQRTQLQRLIDARIAVAYMSLHTDPYKIAIALFIAEFLYHATRAEQHNPNLFAYVETSMRWLDGRIKSFANFHLVFMMRLTRFVGFFPNTDDYHKGDCFDMRQACFTSVMPLHTDCITGNDAERIVTLMRMNYDTMGLFKMSRHDRNSIVATILHYYALHIPNFPELRSLSVMRELMDVQQLSI